MTSRFSWIHLSKAVVLVLVGISINIVILSSREQSALGAPNQSNGKRCSPAPMYVEPVWGTCSACAQDCCPDTTFAPAFECGYYQAAGAWSDGQCTTGYSAIDDCKIETVNKDCPTFMSTCEVRDPFLDPVSCECIVTRLPEELWLKQQNVKWCEAAP